MQPVMRAKSAQFGYLQRRVADGDYQIDAKRVAAAMLQRIGALVSDREISGEFDRAHRTAGAGPQGA